MDKLIVVAVSCIAIGACSARLGGSHNDNLSSLEVSPASGTPICVIQLLPPWPYDPSIPLKDASYKTNFRLTGWYQIEPLAESATPSYHRVCLFKQSYSAALVTPIPGEAIDLQPRSCIDVEAEFVHVTNQCANPVECSKHKSSPWDIKYRCGFDPPGTVRDLGVDYYAAGYLVPQGSFGRGGYLTEANFVAPANRPVTFLLRSVSDPHELRICSDRGTRVVSSKNADASTADATFVFPDGNCHVVSGRAIWIDTQHDRRERRGHYTFLK